MRKVSATIVNVGFRLPAVGNTELPLIHHIDLGWAAAQASRDARQVIVYSFAGLPTQPTLQAPGDGPHPSAGVLSSAEAR